MSYGTIALIAVALLFLTPLSRILLAALFGRSIGQAALARQPDAIHLKSTDASKLRQVERVKSIVSQYQQRGFEDAGLYAIPEMPGVFVQLLANRADSMYGAIYDHPVAGVFYDVVSRYADGSVCTHTTARATGIKQRPNVQMVNLPGSEPAALIDNARRDRPPAGLKSCSSSTAVTDFETAYAEYMAWIKQRGLSTSEVVNVAKRKVA
jgi:hypothetical protein